MTITPAHLARQHARNHGRFGPGLDQTIGATAYIHVRKGAATRQARILRKAARSQ